MPIAHRSVRMDLLTSKEVAEYLQKSDLVIVPIGCFEMHGPVLPLATDTWISWAIAILMAEQYGGLAAPPVSYTYPGATGPWPGTADISPDATIAYIREVALAFLKGKFKRVILCSFHGPLGPLLQPVIRSIHQQTGQVVMSLGLGPSLQASLKEEFGREGEDWGGDCWGENLAVLGAMRVLGVHEALRPDTSVNKPGGLPSTELGQIMKMGASVPWLYSEDQQHVGIYADLKLEHAERAERAFVRAVAGMAELPKLFASFQEQMRKLADDQPWSSPNIWSM